MKKALAILLCLTFCLAACAPAAESYLLPSEMSVATETPAPTLSPEEEAAAKAPAFTVPELKCYATRPPEVSFTNAAYLESAIGSLADSAPVIPAVSAPHDGRLYVYRNYPNDLDVPASSYLRKPGFAAQTQIEIYNADGTPGGIITLALPGNLLFSAMPGGMTADADGITLLFSTFEYTGEGRPVFNSNAYSLYRFGYDGALLEAVPFTLTRSQSPARLLRAGGRVYALMSDSPAAGHTDSMTDGEKAVDAVRRAGYRTLCVFDPAAGVFTPITREGFTDAALLGAAAYPEGKILCADMLIVPDAGAPAVQVSVFDPATGASVVLTDAWIAMSDSFSPQMAYDPAADALFFIQNDEFMVWRLGTSAPITRLLKGSSVLAYDDLFILDGAPCLIRRNARVDRLADLTLPKADALRPGDVIAYGSMPSAAAIAAAEGTSLTILANMADKDIYPYFQRWYSGFEFLDHYYKEYKLPPIALTPKFYGDVKGDIVYPEAVTAPYYQTLVKKLLAGDDDFDLFFIGGEYYEYCLEYLNGMIDNRYLKPLDNLGLAPLYDDMLPGVKELCSANGQIVLVPMKMDFTGHWTNYNMLRALGLDIHDTPQTIDELIAFFPQYEQAAKDYGAGLYYDRSGALRTLSMQYAVAFHESDPKADEMWDTLIRFADSLDRYERVRQPDEGYLAAARTLFKMSDRNMVVGNKAYDDYTLEHTGIQQNDAYCSTKAPLLTADSTRPLSSAMFVGVNPNSKNFELVAEFLDIYLSKSYHDYRVTQTLSGAKINVTDQTTDAYYSDFGSTRLQAVFYDVPSLPREDYPIFAWYKEMLPEAVRGYPGMADGTDIYDYKEGTLSAADWKAKFDRMLEFLRDE